MARSAPFPLRGLSIAGVGALALCWFLTLSADGQALAAPCLGALAVAGLLLGWLYALDGKAPLLDAGALCVVATLLYMILPLVGYALNGMQFSLGSDPRLEAYQPGPDALGRFHWRHVAYLASFSLVYAFLRWRWRRRDPATPKVSPRMFHAVLLIFGALSIYFFALERIAGVSYAFSYSELDQAESGLRALPLPVAQASHYLYKMLFVLKIALLVILLQRIKQPKWLLILVLWVLFEIATTLSLQGARTPLVLFALSGTVLYHRLVRPLPLWAILSGGVVLVTWFLYFGISRKLDVDPSSGLLTSGNEFLSLLGTAWDMYQRDAVGNLEVPWQVYLNDVIRLLPPRQFLPFEKIDASNWYLSLTDHGLRGVRQTGRMWGVMSQTTIGFGVYELVVRGAVLGFVLARLHRYYQEQGERLLVTVLYVWVCAYIYLTYRDTTFALLHQIAYVVLPTLLAVMLITRALSRSHNASATSKPEGRS